jgi:hypothetical protein
VPRRILEPKRGEVSGGENCNNEQLRYLYSSPSTIRLLKSDEEGGACSPNGEKIITCRLLVGKPEGKRPLGKSRSRWVVNVKMHLLGTG